MKKLLIALTLCLGIATLPSTVFADQTLYSKSEIKEDIDFLIKTMEDVHPNLYSNFPEKNFDSAIEFEFNEIKNPISAAEIFTTFEPILSKLNDGHTGIRVPNDFIKSLKETKNLFGIIAELKDGKINFLNASIPNALEYKNCEIISINGESTEQIYNQMINYISGTNLNYREIILNKNFVAYYHLEHPFEKVYKIKIKTTENKIKELIIPSVDTKTYENLYSTEKSVQKKDFSYKQLNETTVCLTFNSFSDFDKFQLFLDDMFKEIKTNSIDNLIIDIRENGGGNSRLGDLLIESIYNKPFSQTSRSEIKISNEILNYYTKIFKDRSISDEDIKKQIDQNKAFLGKNYPTQNPITRNYLDNSVFNGNVYVLTSDNTFSSATMFAATIKDYNIGQIIGEETGGLATHFGDLYTFTLPNSNLNAYVSHKYFVRPNGLNTHHGVIPDYDIKNLDNRDALEIALEIIENL